MNVRRSILITAAVLFAPLTARAEAPWELLMKDEGIEVFRREVPGSSFVEFRGRGVVNAPIQKIAAVIRNSERRPEWMHNNAECRAVEYKSATHILSYTRIASPAPLVSERDAVIEGFATAFPAKKMLRLDFRAVEHRRAPPRDGVVRMPEVKGHWTLLMLGDNRTEVDYQVRADPGGWLPAWVVNWASKKLPFHTLKNLRTQVSKGGYDNDILVVERSLDWDAFIAGTDTRVEVRSVSAPLPN